MKKHANSIGHSVYPPYSAGLPRLLELSFPHIATLTRAVKIQNRLQHRSNDMSALAETPDGPIEVIQVLIALHPSFGAQELCGPLEVLSNAFHKLKDPGTLSSLLPTPVSFLGPLTQFTYPPLMHLTCRIEGF